MNDSQFLTQLNYNSWTGFRNHCLTIRQPLERMNLQTQSFVFRPLHGVVMPHYLIIGRVDFHDFRPGGLQQDVSSGQDMQVMERSNSVFPCCCAVLIDDGHSAL
jgi:hypothetical protein